MTPWLLPLVVSFGITAISTPLVRVMLTQQGVVDTPNARSLHLEVVPRGGGLACAAGVIGGTVVAAVRDVDGSLLIAVTVCLGLAALGFLDDRVSLPALPRLGGQILAGGACGILVRHSILWLVIGVVVVAATVNMVNFMDGINGISGLTLAIWGVVALIVGSREHLGQLELIGAVSAAAAIGFLPVNFPKARMFLGDAGSYLFGGLVGLGVLYGLRSGAPVLEVLAPLSIYMFDTAYTMIVRASRRENLLAAHRDHIYQRLVSEAGLSHVAASGLVAIGTACVASVWLWANHAVAAAVTLLVLVIYLFSVQIVRRASGSTASRTK